MHRFWGAMQESAPPFQQVFHDLVGAGAPERLRASPLRPLYETATWAEVIDGLRDLPRAAASLPDAGAAPETMVIAEVEALWTAIDRDDDWTPLAEKVARVRAAGARNARARPAGGPQRPPGPHAPRLIRCDRR